jgi:hypothetical protein
LTNFESSLLIVLKRFGQENLFLISQEKNEWKNLSMKQKIDIIWMICELRIQLNDVEAKFNVSSVTLVLVIQQTITNRKD